MRRSKDAPNDGAAEKARAEGDDASRRIDAALLERARAGDRAFAEELERWKQRQIAETDPGDVVTDLRDEPTA